MSGSRFRRSGEVACAPITKWNLERLVYPFIFIDMSYNFEEHNIIAHNMKLGH